MLGRAGRDWCAAMATPAPAGDIPEKPFRGLVRQVFKVPGLADGNGCTMYDATNDSLLPFVMMDAKSGKLSSSFSESEFIFGGLSNWKYATRCFNSHGGSLKH